MYFYFLLFLLFMLVKRLFWHLSTRIGGKKRGKYSLYRFKRKRLFTVHEIPASVALGQSHWAAQFYSSVGSFS